MLSRATYSRFVGTDALTSARRFDEIAACAMCVQISPRNDIAFAGTYTWAGIARRKPFLAGKTLHSHGLDPKKRKMVTYPIIDGCGR